MKKNGFYIITSLAILAVGGYFLKKEYDKRKSTPMFDKNNAINFIVSSGKHSNRDFLQTLESDFLIAWANATYLGKKSFDYKNKQYLTQGGKSL